MQQVATNKKTFALSAILASAAASAAIVAGVMTLGKVNQFDAAQCTKFGL